MKLEIERKKKFSTDDKSENIPFFATETSKSMDLYLNAPELDAFSET